MDPKCGRSAAPQEGSLAVGELYVDGPGDQLKRRRLVFGTSLIDEVVVSSREYLLAARADGNAEKDEVVLRVEDLGEIAELAGRQGWEVDSETRDARRKVHPEAHPDAVLAFPLALR